MSATSNVVLPDYAAVSRTFVPSVAISGGFQYVDNGSSLSALRTMDVKHTMPDASKSGAVDTHLVGFRKNYVNAAGLTKTITANLTLRIPRDAAVADYKDLAWFIRNFVTDTNIGSLVLGGF